ncbi:MAG: electron transport complex subunit E [Gammaproteobacteria bacterium]|mgnify:FL=1|nr:MAG: electron transport complex subunit E [Gammaproteobacteria bacterium]
MAKVSYKEISINGLWKNNPVLVQLLGLCPALAVTASFVNALGLSMATTATLIASNVVISLIRNFVKSEIRIPVFIIVIASAVTVVELLVKAFAYDLYLVLGIFLPLIVTNCVILGRAEAFASKNTVVASFVDGLMGGIGFTIILCSLGAMREVIGNGTLFDGMHLMFGEAAKAMTLTIIPNYKGFLLAILPPGAFIGLGLLLAGKNIIDHRS